MPPHRDADYWTDMHLRLCQGDRRARDELCSLLALLTRFLSRYAPPHKSDASLVTESAEDALLYYLTKPERFDPSRGCSLLTWLTIQARGHLSNRLRKEQRRQEREQTVGVSDEDFRKKMSEMRFEATIFRGRDEEEKWKGDLEHLKRFLTPHDCEETELLLRGASCADWVHYLHIEDLSLKE